jgi:hypothetical protein
MKKAVTLLLFLLTSHLLIAQTFINVSWQKALGGTKSDAAYSVQKTGDGGYIVAGESKSTDDDVSGNHGGSDCWVVKLNSSGIIEWKKSLGGSLDEGYYSRIIQTADGGYCLVTKTSSSNGEIASGHHGGEDCWVVKLSNIGGIEWQKALGGTRGEAGFSLVQTSDAGYIIVGGTYSNDGDVSGNHGNSDCWVVKLNSLGSLQWQKALGGSSNESGSEISQTADGGYIIAGGTNSNDGNVSGNHGGNDAWVVKLSNSGAVEWQKTLGGTNDDYFLSIKQTADGGYIIAGGTNSNDGDVSGNHGDYDTWIVKLSSSGAIQWQKALGGSGGEEIESIIQTTDEGYIAAGYTESNDNDISGNHGNTDYWVIKLSSVGIIEWQKALGGTGNDYARSITITGGGYVIAGYSTSNDGDVSGNHGGGDFWIANLSVRNFTVSPNYPCQDKYVKLTSEGCVGTTRWYAYPEGQTPTLTYTGVNYNYLVSNAIPLSTAIFFKCECTTTSGFVISMGEPKFVRVLGASSYNFVSPADDFTSTPPYPLNVANSITAANKILTPTPPITTRVEYRAEKGILLKPGFRADKGTVFMAQIGGCQ